MNKSFNTYTTYGLIILISLFFILVLTFVFKLSESRSRYYIIAKFSESGPLYKNMPVYYKGVKIGQAKDIKISDDYQYSLVKIELYPSKPKLSTDIVAKVKNHNVRKEYIDLSVPDQASSTLLKNGSTIDGEGAFDLEAFLSDIADSGLIIPLLQTFSDTLASINKTSVQVENFFTDSRSILKDNRQNIKQSTKDFAQTSKSLTKLTSNINNSITEEKINSTTSSINKSSNNVLTATETIKDITKNIDSATKNLDKTIAKIDCTISEANKITTNVKVITCGLRETLEKRFAGMRIMFGKPLNKNGCVKNCLK